FGAVFDALIRRDGQGGYAPALAESWHTSPDARIFTFQLRPHIRFHNGDPVDADAVRFSLMRMADPAQGSTLGAPGVYAQYLTGMAVDILGPQTLRITLAQPLADIADILSYGHIVSPRAIGVAGDDLTARMVGTGPYRLTGWDPGRSITAVANQDHFAGPPGLAAIRWEAHPTPAARAAALRDGRADCANHVENATFDPSIFRLTYLSPTVMIYLLNAASGPCADARVRRALNLAIDRDALVADILGGAGRPLAGFVSPNHVGFDPAAPIPRHDVSQARRLLAEAGYASGLALSVDCPTRMPDEAEALTAALARQFAPLGITFAVTIHSDRIAYANRVREKRIGDLCVFDSSPMSTFRVLTEKIDSRFAGSWWQGYRNQAVEALIDTARTTTDAASRTAIYRHTYRLLQQDPPWLTLYNHTRTIALAAAHPHFTMPDDGVLDVRRLNRLQTAQNRQV
ncbi:MAG: peptide ABC transporter substrate-binding protein, partial [Acetobacteraceae bacterium]|nr:peptide ABC transporter substrate-binding protein [Acetobacteraceae bacterium]